MAVAVKNKPEVAAANPFDRLPVVCLAGVVYILGCLGIVLKLIPSLFGPLISGMGVGEIAAGILLGFPMLVAALLLIFLGGRLFGGNAPVGTRAGLFVSLAGVLLVLLLTRWASMWIEHWIYRDYFFGTNGPMVGAALSAAIGLGLLGYGIRLLFKKSTERLLVAFEEQGWFSVTSYKPLQGQRVRRGTIVGVLLIAGAGIYTLLVHETLSKGSPNWELNIPFTPMVTVNNPGDVPVLQGLVAVLRQVDNPADAAEVRRRLSDFLAQADIPKEVAELLKGVSTKAVRDEKNSETVLYPYLSRYELRAINALEANPNKYVKVTDPGRSDALRGKEGTLVPKTTFDEEVDKLQREFDRENELVKDDAVREAELKKFKDSLPKKVDPEPASGPTTFSTLTLLPGVQFTLPLLLLVSSLWLAWRVVSLPTFADFLIATEAELNKVSWTTRKRLFQDTIVVLTTVFLMAMFLFVMDQTWRVILSWKPIGVLQFHEDPAEQNKSVDEKPW